VQAAVSFHNPDFVDVVIQSYRHRFGVRDADARAERAEADAFMFSAGLTEKDLEIERLKDEVLRFKLQVQALDIASKHNQERAEAEAKAMRGALENLVEAMSHHGTVMHAYVWRAHIEARTVLAGGKLVELPPLLDQFKSSLDTRLNNMLCEMKEGYDDSVVGFNEAWDVMRKAFDDFKARAALQQTSPAAPTGRDIDHARTTWRCADCGAEPPIKPRWPTRICALLLAHSRTPEQAARRGLAPRSDMPPP
jgi:hypothetical protein